MKVIQKEDLDIFLNKLKENYDFFDCANSQLPPKQYFLPQEEGLFEIRKNSGEISYSNPPKEFILYGLSVRDIEAIAYLDEIMRKPPRDPFYFARRGKALLIGLSDEYFDVPAGGDIFLRPLKNGDYETIIATKKGEESIKKFGIELQEKDSPEYEKIENNVMPKLKKLLLDPELLKDAVKWSWEGLPGLWNELEQKCMGCGVCTYVCPLCHCFEMEDKVDLDDSACRRCRLWSACTVSGFSGIAGGHNFHKNQKERYYNWFYHKFVRGYMEFGKSQCVACGRCKDQCPAGIDIEEVLIKITNEYKNAKKSKTNG